MKKITSQKLAKRLAQYGALSLAVTGIAESNGQNIIYTDVDPDEGGPGYLYLLNMDGGLTQNDFALRHFNSATSGGGNYNVLVGGVYSSSAQPNNAIFGYDQGVWQYPFALDSGVTISNSMMVSSTSNFGSMVPGAWVYDGFQTLNYADCTFSFDNWCPNQGDKYLGLRFEIAGQIHFGWARIEVGTTAGDWLIKDYAYHDTPNAPINAGQTVLGIEDNILNQVKVVALSKSIALYNLPDVSRYNIINMTGQQVLKGETQNRDYVIEAPSLASGVYILELNDINSDAVLRKKVVLQ
ncbi:T9SS type A sorting domain-containing protein [Yeosuana sp. MJ-SS3]|uniref:T9SS type A sorting domain-containing protein n=1 Tax=Gilvirhabdus luticola TaxID=3079858 RepID=A0ABU3U5T7_9FLAO|nr:T9SS type A sorting domain-containing protein [Yeosuana sp. MJ-SS3]MDU8885768.1 T9SS type A sorting domain-containing protein [Yeosuana sp. MJ-SS3]